MSDRNEERDEERDEVDRLTRRAFLSQTLRRGGAVGAGLSIVGPALPLHATPPPSPSPVDRPARTGDPAPRIRRRVQLGRTGIEVPDISFGSFALESDEALVRHALDRGVTHFDTAESYGEGRSEEVLGRALRGRRHEVTLTSKFWAKPEHTTEYQMGVLERSLRRLQTDYIDIYLNHAVNDVARLESEAWLTFVERARRDGKIRAVGISGHAGRLGECLTHALDSGIVDVILVAYNFSQEPSFRENLTRYLKDLAASFDLVTTHPDLPRLLDRAHAEGVGVMVMKTLKGARRNDMRPFETAGGTFAQAAFRWVLSNPSVDGLVVSMNDRAMVDEYVAASGSGPPRGEDLALLARYLAFNAGRACQIGCGRCEARCPAGVPIADVMRMRMYDRDYGLPAIAAREYAALATDATACLACDGAPCASACPNDLPIAGFNRETHRRLRSVG